MQTDTPKVKGDWNRMFELEFVGQSEFSQCRTDEVIPVLSYDRCVQFATKAIFVWLTCMNGQAPNHASR